jgi:uncharacterized protein YjiS (DUF1127 family)
MRELRSTQHFVRAALLCRARKAMEMKMSAISFLPVGRLPGRWVRWLKGRPNRAVGYWQRREMIKILRSLDDHQLRDIGIQRHQIEAAVNGTIDSNIARFR